MGRIIATLVEEESKFYKQTRKRQCANARRTTLTVAKAHNNITDDKKVEHKNTRNTHGVTLQFSKIHVVAKVLFHYYLSLSTDGTILRGLANRREILS